MFRINYRLTTPLGEIGHLILISDASNATNQSYEIQVSLHSTPFYSILLQFTPIHCKTMNWMKWKGQIADVIRFWNAVIFFRAPSISTAFSLVYWAQLKIEKKKKKKKKKKKFNLFNCKLHSVSFTIERIKSDFDVK